jgi:putative transposase
VQGDRSAQVEPALRGSQGAKGSPADRADGRALAGEPRYGYRRVWSLLRREGWPVNKKRVHRLWRQKGLKVPQKQCKRRRLPNPGGSENSCTRRQAEHKDHVWSYDFVMDLTEDDRRLKMMPVVDEYTRECLCIDVECSISAEDVVSTLASLFRNRGEPAFIRAGHRARVYRQNREAVAGSIRG